MKRVYLNTDARYLRDAGQSFEAAVIGACAFHERRGLGVATHCSVDPDEPGIVGRVGDVTIVSNGYAGIGNFCAHIAKDS